MTWQIWREHNLESQFNPRAAIGEKTNGILLGWANQSNKRRSELKGLFDIPYGEHPLMQYDRHVAHGNDLIIINIHGGYFRALDKSDMDHHMADLVKAGNGVININYPLCPEVSLTEIIAALINGIKKILSDLSTEGLIQKIILMGHSAGAHLAMHLSQEKILQSRLVGIIALSGAYELGFIRELTVNQDVRLSSAEMHQFNCLNNLPAQGPKYYIAVGGGEPSGWIDQSWLIARELTKRGDDTTFHVCSKANHFNLIDYLCDSENPEGALLNKWIKSILK